MFRQLKNIMLKGIMLFYLMELVIFLCLIHLYIYIFCNLYHHVIL